MPLKILADDMMPLVDELFSPVAQIIKRPGRAISVADVKEVDALLCRSVTRVDQQLLTGSRVKFVGSATIGTDHMDTCWLEEQGIHWTNATGCNAAAVAQYVLSAIAFWCIRQRRDIRSLTIGIVGVGNVGSCLERYCHRLGIATRLCDPPLREAGVEKDFQALAQLMDCDVLTLHVPLTDAGDYPTKHLVDSLFLSKLHSNQLLINASRGEVIDKMALLDYLNKQDSASLVLDVFADEPTVDKRIIDHCLLATPHIAGHTLEGKIRGSWMVYQQFCECFDLPQESTESEIYPPPTLFDLPAQSLELQLLCLYPIENDSHRLKKLAGAGHHAAGAKTAADGMINPNDFDALRKNYLTVEGEHWRRDYLWCKVRGADTDLLKSLLIDD